MYKCRTRRSLIFILSAAAFFLAAVIFNLHSEKYEPGRPVIISAAQAEKFTDHKKTDLSSLISYCGNAAAVDKESAAVYISHPLAGEISFLRLISGLEISYGDVNMYLVEDPYFKDMSRAVRESHPFRMILSDGSSKYTEYSLIVTNLPVISIEGKEAYSIENGYRASRGRMTVWGGDSKGNVETFSSNLIWQPRGASSLRLDKKSQKCILLDKKGRERKAEILGMGSDDDWLLNAMYIDDQKTREQLFMKLWNEWAETADYNYKMSEGKYVELLVNGSYCGLHLLQRQVEGKLLGLEEGDILLKGKYSTDDYLIENYYDIKNPDIEPGEKQKIFSMLEESGLLRRLDVDNFMDVAAFLQFASAPDNVGEKNMFYIVHSGAEEPYTSLVPWDTDISFGICWLEDIAYDYDFSLNYDALRYEYYTLRDRYPELDSMLYERWKSLRGSVLNEDNIISVLHGLQTELDSSGALIRDGQRWGLFHGGVDSRENMESFIRERLELLDKYYAERADAA